MQDRRQICFVVALVGGVLALGSALMMLAMSSIVFGAAPVPMGVPGMGFFVGLLAWLAVASALGGVAMIVGGVKVRNAAGPALRAGAYWCIAGGVLTALGGNLLSAAAGIVAGALVLAEPTPPA